MNEDFETTPIPLSVNNYSIVKYLNDASFDNDSIEMFTRSITVSFMGDFKLINMYADMTTLMAMDICEKINNREVVTVGEIRIHFNKNIEAFLSNNKVPVRNAGLLKADGFYIYLSMLKNNMKDICESLRRIKDDEQNADKEKAAKKQANEITINLIILIVFIVSIIAVFFYYK